MTTLPQPVAGSAKKAAASIDAHLTEAQNKLKTKPKPAVTVLMTAHNAELYLREALDSLLDQTFQDFELVVVNDGSTDRTSRILTEYAGRDERITVLTNRVCSGISKAANRGLAACRADIIARMDADDIAYPERLEKQLAFFRRSGAVAVGCFVEFIDAKGRPLTVIPSPRDNKTIQKRLLKGDCTVWHTGSMISADALRQVGGYNEKYGSAVDMELWLRLGEVGELANQPATLQKYRYYNTSVSAKRRDEQMRLCQQATVEAAARRGIKPQFVPKAHWRCGKTRASKLQFMLKLGWWAHKSGHRRVTAIYALKALALMPHSWEAWMMLKAATVAPLRDWAGYGRTPRLAAPA